MCLPIPRIAPSARSTNEGVCASECDDSVRNGRETGVDCGGDCPACPAAAPALRGAAAKQSTTNKVGQIII